MKTALCLLISLTGCGSAATIGGTEVPDNLHCEEDEVIAFDSTQEAPYPLACIHIDTIRGEG